MLIILLATITVAVAVVFIDFTQTLCFLDTVSYSTEKYYVSNIIAASCSLRSKHCMHACILRTSLVSRRVKGYHKNAIHMSHIMN